MLRRRPSGRQTSLRVRATAWYTGLLAASLLLFSIGIYAGVRTYLKLTLQSGLSATAEAVTSTLASRAGSADDASVMRALGESYSHMMEGRYVRVLTGGRVIFQTATVQNTAIHLDRLPLPAYSDVPAYHRVRQDDQNIMRHVVPFTAGDGRVYQIETGTSLRTMQTRMNSLAVLLSLGSLAILLMAALGAYLLMKQPLRPLRVLAEKAEDIGRKELGERLPDLHTGDELERLTDSLNGMIGRLEEALAHNHRFSADASHELRTPLTIMHGEIEELLEAESLPASAVDNLVSLLDEVERMSRIVASLMTITRLDAGGERMDLGCVALDELVATTVEHMRLLAQAKGIQLTFTRVAPVSVLADRTHMERVLVNLIDNAVKYTPSVLVAGKPAVSSHIRLTLTAETGFATLVVADQGVGISPEALPHVFERFYRADYARSRQVGGVGLGLAIVKSIVASHGGTIAITSAPGEGSTVTVRLPLYAVPPMSSSARETAVEMPGGAPHAALTYSAKP